MKDFQAVDSEDVNTLEQYGAALLASIASLRTLENYQEVALSKGLLDEDEVECSKGIIWELKRLLGLYKTQVHNIKDRTKDFNEDEVIENFRRIMPGIEIPRKQKNVKTKKSKSSPGKGIVD